MPHTTAVVRDLLCLAMSREHGSLCVFAFPADASYGFAY